MEVESSFTLNQKFYKKLLSSGGQEHYKKCKFFRMAKKIDKILKLFLPDLWRRGAVGGGKAQLSWPHGLPIYGPAPQDFSNYNSAFV